MRKGLCFSCMLLYGLTEGQANLYVDQTKIRIGDQVHATIELLSDMGGQWINRDKIWPDSMKGIEVVRGPETSKDNPSGMEAIWTLSFFDTGYVRIPRLPVVVQHHGKTDTFYTQDIPIRVDPVEPDSSGLLAIKNIYIQPFSMLFYKKYIPHLIGLLVLIAGLYYLWKRRKKKPVEVEMPPAPPQPHEWALKALDELAEMRLWQKGEIKEHYTSLTGILREYLERRFAIHALEQTSDEILEQLRQIHLSSSLLEDTSQLLSVADLIKFAKADPGMDIHADTIERVKVFVRETTNITTGQDDFTTKTEDDAHLA